MREVPRLPRVRDGPLRARGATTVLAILGMLETFDLGNMDPETAEPWHLFAEASRLAYADRDRYVADPDVVPGTDGGSGGSRVPRAAVEGHRSGRGDAGAGRSPVSRQARLRTGATGRSTERPSTTHLSVVDRAGNAVALTSSIETAFGSGLMVEGFLLNNQLTDFAFVPQGADGLVANRVAGGKRPRSSMAPTIVTDADGRLRAVLGSPGGIPHHLLRRSGNRAFGRLEAGRRLRGQLSAHLQPWPDHGNRSGHPLFRSRATPLCDGSHGRSPVHDKAASTSSSSARTASSPGQPTPDAKALQASHRPPGTIRAWPARRIELGAHTPGGAFAGRGSIPPATCPGGRGARLPSGRLQNDGGTVMHFP